MTPLFSPGIPAEKVERLMQLIPFYDFLVQACEWKRDGLNDIPRNFTLLKKLPKIS